MLMALDVAASPLSMVFLKIYFGDCISQIKVDAAFGCGRRRRRTDFHPVRFCFTNQTKFTYPLPFIFFNEMLSIQRMDSN